MTFQVEHFTLPSHYEETPLCDRKANLPNLYRDDEKAEFLRDVIALANSARSFGKPVRLLFGIDDHGKPADLGDYLAPYAAHISAGVQLPEKIREQIGKTLATYVKPELSKFDFELGECEGKCVAYLLIHPVPSAKRFRVARDLTSGKQQLLSAGQSWIRFGEHKEEVISKLIDPDSPEEPYYERNWRTYTRSLCQKWLLKWGQRPSLSKRHLRRSVGQQSLHRKQRIYLNRCWRRT